MATNQAAPRCGSCAIPHAESGCPPGGRSQVWLPYAGTVITACADHGERPAGRCWSREDVQEMIECALCLKEVVAEPVERDADDE